MTVRVCPCAVPHRGDTGPADALPLLETRTRLPQPALNRLSPQGMFNMFNMFYGYGASAFNGDLSGWNTAAVIDMTVRVRPCAVPRRGDTGPADAFPLLTHTHEDPPTCFESPVAAGNVQKRFCFQRGSLRLEHGGG